MIPVQALSYLTALGWLFCWFSTVWNSCLSSIPFFDDCCIDWTRDVYSRRMFADILKTPWTPKRDKGSYGFRGRSATSYLELRVFFQAMWTPFLAHDSSLSLFSAKLYPTTEMEFMLETWLYLWYMHVMCFSTTNSVKRTWFDSKATWDTSLRKFQVSCSLCWWSLWTDRVL